MSSISQKFNYKSFLLSGPSGSGKSWSLKNIKKQKKKLYLNCEGGKPLPFKNDFQQDIIDDPYEVQEWLDSVTNDEDYKNCNMVIVDTVSFLMDRYYSVHIKGSSDTMGGWGNYGEFFRDLMQDYVAKCPVPVVFLGHLHMWEDEDTGDKNWTVPVKGALAKSGLEAFFTTVLSTTKVRLKHLQENDLLTITNRDKELGFKHVIQTRTTKATIGDRIRTPDGLFSAEELYIDNDVQNIVDRLEKYYSE